MVSVGMLRIRGGQALKGTVSIEGSKTAACFLLAAAMASDATVTLTGLPWVNDVRAMLGIANANGISSDYDGATSVQLRLGARRGTGKIERRMANDVRASLIAAIALALRNGRSATYLPGGCGFIVRPVDIHIRVLRAAGAQVRCSDDAIAIDATRIHPFSVRVDGAFGTSAGATVSALLVAARAGGTSIIRNASSAPEIAAVIELLSQWGVRVSGTGTDNLVVTGPQYAAEAIVAVMPDRIEAGTYAIAGALTGGQVILRGIGWEQGDNLWMNLSKVGITASPVPNGVAVRRSGSCGGADVVANFFPLFPTDLHPQLVPFLASHEGESRITDICFPGRISHLAPLAEFGILSQPLQDSSGTSAYCVRPSRIRAAEGAAPDIRAGAALVLAALAAESGHWSAIHNIDQIERGYAHLPEKLAQLGGRIQVSSFLVD
jgi:UDP-N-acetylglucosamine 1-carboxyvinyltransferase